MSRFMMWHKDAPKEGVEFDTDRDNCSPESKARQGWVDNPAKLGINLWGPDHESYVRAVKQKYDRGLVKALDDPSFVSADEQKESNYMRLIKFRIQHYKSITDSGWCWLASDVTTLAGKNESGKSAVLEALRDFDLVVESIPDGAKPIDGSGVPMIEMCFEVGKLILDEIAAETSVTIGGELQEHISKNGVTIVKRHDGECHLAEEINPLLHRARNESNVRRIEEIEQMIGQLSKVGYLSGVTTPELEGNMPTIQERVDAYLQEAEVYAASISEEETKQDVHKAIEVLKTENAALDDGDVESEFLDTLLRHTPEFIFFSDFSDILPFEIPFPQAREHKTVQDFAKLAGLDLDKVINTSDSQWRRNILSTCSAKISGDFRGHWEQDEIDLVAEADGENLRLGVRESGGTLLFKAEQRSKGFQWFLSFYLRLNAERAKTKVILIDEPGLYLHSKAQKDVLKVFEILSGESQVIISTHSPYLIDAQRLDRVRLVLKDDQKGTRIENKIHKDADTETLTPIMTAIGLDISNVLSSPVGREKCSIGRHIRLLLHAGVARVY